MYPQTKYLEEIDERRPRLNDPVAHAAWRTAVLGGLHHPLLLFARALFLRALRLSSVLWRRNLLHSLEEIGSFGVRDRECERSVVRESGEGAGGAWEELGRDIAGDRLLRGSRVDGARFGEDESDESEFLGSLFC